MDKDQILLQKEAEVRTPTHHISTFEKLHKQMFYKTYQMKGLDFFNLVLLKYSLTS